MSDTIYVCPDNESHSDFEVQLKCTKYMDCLGAVADTEDEEMLGDVRCAICGAIAGERTLEPSNKYRVELSMLTRSTCILTVEAPSREAVEEALAELYGRTDGAVFEERDVNEGTHRCLVEAHKDAPAQFRVSKDGKVSEL